MLNVAEAMNDLEVLCPVCHKPMEGRAESKSVFYICPWHSITRIRLEALNENLRLKSSEIIKENIQEQGGKNERASGPEKPRRRERARGAEKPTTGTGEQQAKIIKE